MLVNDHEHRLAPPYGGIELGAIILSPRHRVYIAKYSPSAEFTDKPVIDSMGRPPRTFAAVTEEDEVVRLILLGSSKRAVRAKTVQGLELLCQTTFRPPESPVDSCRPGVIAARVQSPIDGELCPYDAGTLWRYTVLCQGVTGREYHYQHEPRGSAQAFGVFVASFFRLSDRSMFIGGSRLSLLVGDKKKAVTLRSIADRRRSDAPTHAEVSPGRLDVLGATTQLLIIL
jgi:hypothetical protein